MWAGNKLRERLVWDDITLDHEWAGLIHKAARQYVEGGGRGLSMVTIVEVIKEACSKIKGFLKKAIFLAPAHETVCFCKAPDPRE